MRKLRLREVKQLTQDATAKRQQRAPEGGEAAWLPGVPTGIQEESRRQLVAKCLRVSHT